MVSNTVITSRGDHFRMYQVSNHYVVHLKLTYFNKEVTSGTKKEFLMHLK